jgi:hypothetical protein
MNTWKRYRRLLLRAIAVFVITLVAVQALYAWFLIHSVDSIVSAVRQLRPGASSQVEIAAFAKRFRLFAQHDNGCEGDFCSYDFVIWNRLLSIPKVTPSTTFIVFLHTHNGVLDQLDVGIFRAESRWALGSRVVRVYDGPYHVPGRPYYRVTGPDYDPVIAIWLDPAASSAERTRAYAFEAKCIALPLGCDRPCDFHREAWKDAKEFMVPPSGHDRRGTFRLDACKQ